MIKEQFLPTNDIAIKDLQSYGVPSLVIERLPKEYQKLFGIQVEAVKSGLFQGKSLLVCAPTSSGKTFVGELAVIVASKRL